MHNVQVNVVQEYGTAHDRAEQKVDECAVVLSAHTFRNEQTMMVEFDATVLTEFAMFARNSLHTHTSLAKVSLKTVCFTLFFLQIGGLNDPSNRILRVLHVFGVHFYQVFEFIRRTVRFRYAFFGETFFQMKI